MQTEKRYQTVAVLYLISHQKESVIFNSNGICCIAQPFIVIVCILSNENILFLIAQESWLCCCCRKSHFFFEELLLGVLSVLWL